MKIPKQWQNTLTVLFFATLIASMSLYLYFTPPHREAFFETSVLSSQLTIPPLTNSTISAHTNITWYLQATSHMPDAQYLEWRIKLLNSTIPRVNPDNCIPSPQTTLYSTRDLLPPTETWQLPLQWSITSRTHNGNNTLLQTLLLNGNTYNPNLPAQNKTGYYLIFELWFYDTATHTWDFQYPFIYEGTPGIRCWYLQVYFQLA